VLIHTYCLSEVYGTADGICAFHRPHYMHPDRRIIHSHPLPPPPSNSSPYPTKPTRLTTQLPTVTKVSNVAIRIAGNCTYHEENCCFMLMYWICLYFHRKHSTTWTAIYLGTNIKLITPLHKISTMDLLERKLKHMRRQQVNPCKGRTKLHLQFHNITWIP
jgi:hypothetical protein